MYVIYSNGKFSYSHLLTYNAIDQCDILVTRNGEIKAGYIAHGNDKIINLQSENNAYVYVVNFTALIVDSCSINIFADNDIIYSTTFGKSISYFTIDIPVNRYVEHITYTLTCADTDKQTFMNEHSKVEIVFTNS